LGLVASLSHPGGNLTGVSILFGELWPKRLELLHDLLPRAGVISALVNTTNRNADFNTKNLQAAARFLGLRLEVLPASNESDIDAAFATIERSRSEALLVGDDPFFADRARQLTALATRWRIPAIYQNRVFTGRGNPSANTNTLSLHIPRLNASPDDTSRREIGIGYTLAGRRRTSFFCWTRSLSASGCAGRSRCKRHRAC
jgi:hypothetical protein